MEATFRDNLACSYNPSMTGSQCHAYRFTSSWQGSQSVWTIRRGTQCCIYQALTCTMTRLLSPSKRSKFSRWRAVWSIQRARLRKCWVSRTTCRAGAPSKKLSSGAHAASTFLASGVCRSVQFLFLFFLFLGDTLIQKIFSYIMKKKSFSGWPYRYFG